MSRTAYSLRTRLLWATAVSMVLIMGVTGFVAKEVSEHEADEVFSARLATSARVLEALLARQLEKATVTQPIVITLPLALEHARIDHPSEDGHPYESKLSFQVWGEDNRLLAKSATAPTEMLGPRIAGFHEHVVNNEIWQVFALQSGVIWIFAAEKNEFREEMSEEMSIAILTPLVVGAILLLLVTHLLALRAIKPVDNLAHSIAQREPNSLEPIRLNNMPNELQLVAGELNKLLSRVRSAFVREQRFTDSAAHELRTPLAAIHLHLQNADAATSPHEIKESVTQALEASYRAKKLAEQLLVYSRVSSSVGFEEKTSLDLAASCRQVVNMMAPITEQRHQKIEVNNAGPVFIYAEKTKIESLIQNLIENASIHGGSPGVISIGVHGLDNTVSLSVENAGPAIPDEEKSKVFIPYYRPPGVSASGTGLGLAIVQEIANQHSATVEIEDRTPGEGVRIRVRFAAGTLP
ncbi:MAG: sensor histidine kinase [Burkholderiaceae bacterium]|nr:sensor histidine kinase [Burkholderiaceae bacterium]